VEDATPAEHVRALFAVSSLCRNNPAAVAALRTAGGLAALATAAQQSPRLQIKAAALLTDLIVDEVCIRSPSCHSSLRVYSLFILLPLHLCPPRLGLFFVFIGSPYPFRFSSFSSLWSRFFLTSKVTRSVNVTDDLDRARDLARSSFTRTNSPGSISLHSSASLLLQDAVAQGWCTTLSGLLDAGTDAAEKTLEVPLRAVVCFKCSVFVVVLSFTITLSHVLVPCPWSPRPDLCPCTTHFNT
jgi:hypothetical protein